MRLSRRLTGRIMRRIACLALLAVSACSTASDALPGWSTDYEAAAAKAKDKKLPLVIDFGTTWCAPCKKMETTTFRDRDVMNLIESSYVAVKVDADKRADLVTHFGVTAYPTIVIVGTDGKMVARRQGYVEPGSFLKWLLPFRGKASIVEARPADAPKMAAAAAANEYAQATREAEVRLAERYRSLAARNEAAGRPDDAASYRHKAAELDPKPEPASHRLD